jgi:multicomponent K+:H+ antiporter subunit E
MIKARLKGWIPHPILSILLLVCWLLLNNTVSNGHIVLGSLLAIVIPLFSSSFWPEDIHVKNPKKIIHFFFIVAYDIVVANIKVAIRILGPNSSLKPSFIKIPLDARNNLTISLLASTISLTPGTVSTDISLDKKILLVHALHVDDMDGEIESIKSRYEKPLMEIFESC